MRDFILWKLNGKEEKIFNDEVFFNLADYLRNKKHLKGTKVVCAEGDCGACTVLLKKPKDSRFKSVNSCVLPLFSLDGSEVITIDGLREQPTDFFKDTLLQMSQLHGAQCGYCTPGFVMQITALKLKQIDIKNQDLQTSIHTPKLSQCLSGNLCRCTGYEPILKAAENILAINKTKSENESLNFGSASNNTDSQNPSQNLFTTLELNKTVLATSVLIHSHLSTEKYEVFIPKTLKEALIYRQNHSDCVIVAGGTDTLVQWNKGFKKSAKILFLQSIHELSEIQITATEIKIGCNISLTELGDSVTHPTIQYLMERFASEQIRNAGTLVGNIVNASPIGDTLPLLYAMNAQLVLSSINGTRTLAISKFILGYRKTALRSDEIVTSVIIPNLNNKIYLHFEKVARRTYLDIAIVNFAGSVQITRGIIEKINLIFGGAGPTPIELTALSQSLCGQKWERSVFENRAPQIPTFLSARSDLRASRAYREKVAQNLFLDFFDKIESQRMSS